MHKSLYFAVFLLLAATGLSAATLEKLTLDDMILKSTEIVRGKVVSQSPVNRNGIIYTRTSVQVLERWKGTATSTVNVSLPGGTIGGIRQHFPGTPELKAGQEYVFFLWTGSSGVTQIIGLSQGLFTLQQGAKGASLQRSATRETMLDPGTGREIQDESMELTLTQMSARIKSTLEGASK